MSRRGRWRVRHERDSTAFEVIAPPPLRAACHVYVMSLLGFAGTWGIPGHRDAAAPRCPSTHQPLPVGRNTYYLISQYPAIRAEEYNEGPGISVWEGNVSAQPSEPIFDVRVLRDLRMPMRDGTLLAADVYLPAAEGAWPTLLERTPYNKESSSEIALDAPTYFASRGYAVVIQDTRGRFKSAGEFRPFHDDGWRVNRDGYDTVEWIAGQPWSNGKVGTIGGSYSGATQYQMLPTRPPHLVAQFVRESSSDYHAEWVYRGGALELAFILPWALNVTLSNLAHLVPPEQLEAHRGALTRAVEEIGSWFTARPLAPCPLLAGLSDWYNDWLDHPDDGPFWWQWNLALKSHEVDTPVYHLGGWFDGFLRGTLENFRNFRRQARTERARSGQKLLVGPWIHGPTNLDQRVIGEIDYGPEAALQLNPLRLRWFDYWEIAA